MSAPAPSPLEKELYALELELMRPATRSSRAILEELLDEDFVAFASSGVAYDRQAATGGSPAGAGG